MDERQFILAVQRFCDGAGLRRKDTQTVAGKVRTVGRVDTNRGGSPPSGDRKSAPKDAYFAAHPGINKRGQFELFGDDCSYLCEQDDAATVRAYRLARQARFEHGEKPQIGRYRHA